MTVYYITLATVFIFGFLSRISDEKKYKILSVFWILLIIVVMVLFSGFRSGVGDTYYYEHSYDLLVQSGKIGFSGKDFGFSLFSYLLTKLSSDHRILIFTCALITNVINIYVFYKYRNSMELQIFMYITTGYLTTSMNGIRQCLAASLVFLCTSFLIKRKPIQYITCIIAISTIHQSALFMIPIYFIIGMEPWSRKFYLFIVLACVGIVFYNYISPFIFKALENTQYGEYSEFKEGGSSFARFAISTLPILLAYYKKDVLKAKLPESNIFINIALINAVFVGFGMWNWIFNRFSLYLQLYNFILLPFIISQCLEGKEKRTIYFFFILCYFYFFYREHVIGYHMNYKSILDLEDFFYTNTLAM